ncbi:MAG: hypothetical protein ABSA39_19910 [Edaphobacter sp.]
MSSSIASSNCPAAASVSPSSTCASRFPGSAANTFTLTIATPGATASTRNPARGSTHPPIVWALLLLPAVGLALRPRGYRIPARLVVLATLTFALLTATGCGDRISTADALLLSAKNYTITVTGTATSPTGSILQHSTNVTLVLEQPQ